MSINPKETPIKNMLLLPEEQREALAVFSDLPEIQLLHYNEPAPGLFLAETITVIGRALDAGYEPVSFLVQKELADGQARALLARCPNTPVYTGTGEEIVSLTRYALPRGILCAMRRKQMPDPKQLIANAKRIVVLEKITNPTNVGAIVRSAAALGMDAVLLAPGCADPLYRRAARVSVGTVFQIPWITLDGEAERGACPVVEQLKEQGVCTVAMALDECALPLDDPQLRKPEKLAIVLGSEGYGLLPETVNACDHTVMIPMMHGVDSLNVAAASAVAFWELRSRDVPCFVTGNEQDQDLET